MLLATTAIGFALALAVPGTASAATGDILITENAADGHVLASQNYVFFFAGEELLGFPAKPAESEITLADMTDVPVKVYDVATHALVGIALPGQKLVIDNTVTPPPPPPHLPPAPPADPTHPRAAQQPARVVHVLFHDCFIHTCDADIPRD
jgi:hypothetical protein